MRVLIDTSYAARAPLSGTGVYIRKLCEQLELFDEVEVLHRANQGRRGPAGGGAGSVRNLLSDLRWTAVTLPRLARELRAEVIHHPLAAFSPGARRVQVVTIHDLAFERVPDCFDRRFRTYARLIYRAAARRAAAVICDSHTTAADVRELWGLAASKIVVAQLGPGQEFGSGRLGGEPRPGHFLYVGDDEPRKDLPSLLAAYDIYRTQTAEPLPLVLAGAASAQAPGVVVERSPSRERLAELYASAVGLVQPSLYEGFGLTALEAMSAGVPVIAARSPGLIEVCGDAALWADPGDVKDFSHAMVKLVADRALREQLAGAGRRRAQEFSWARCARAHLDAYSLALAR